MKLDEIRYHHFRQDPQKVKRYSDRGIGSYYNDAENKPYGLTGEWLIDMGAKREDLLPAMEKARKSGAYLKLMAAGFREEPTKRDTTNGTFVLRIDHDIPIGEVPKWSEKEPKLYRILLNGRISGHSLNSHGDTKWKQAKLTSPAPITASSAPDLSPSDRIAKTYVNSFEHLLSWSSKKRTAEFLRRIKKD